MSTPQSTATKRSYEAVRPALQAALDAYRRTEHARQTGYPGSAKLGTYEEFTQFLPMSPVEAARSDLSDLTALGGAVEAFRTTGTRGRTRSILWPRNTAADVRSLVDRSNLGRITVTYAAAIVETDIFLTAHIRGFRQVVGSAILAPFADRNDVRRLLQDSDTIVLIDYPSALARFIRLIEDLCNVNGDEAAPAGKRIIARLTGEPMRAAVFQTWHERAEALGIELRIEMRYGCTEFLGIGKSDFNPQGGEVEYRLTDQGCFAEVLDPETLEPVYEGVGTLVATAFRTAGTILYRYFLGDRVEIFERSGRRYVRNIGRSDVLIVTGNTVSLSDFVTMMRAEIGLEVCLDVRKRVDSISGVQSININVHVPEVGKLERERASALVAARLIEQLNIGPKVDAGFAVVSARAQALGVPAERRRKAWKLL